MKTKEELIALKEEVETINKKLSELNEDELVEIFGGHNRLDSSETTLDHNTIGTSQKNAPDTLSSGFNVESFTANLK